LGDAVSAVAAPAAITAVAAPAAIAAETTLTASSTAIIWIGRGTAEALTRRTHATAATAACATAAAQATGGSQCPLTGGTYGKGTVAQDTISAIIPEEDSEGAAAPTAAFTAGTALTTLATATTAAARAIGIAIVNREARYIIGNAS
jgi:hypothetical protein